MTGQAGDRAPARAPAEAARGFQPELAWLALGLVCVVAIVAFPAWQIVPLIATLFMTMAWLAHRKILAADRTRIAAEADRLLRLQRQFLQDASHQLRTPITIALGHAELLAGALADRQQRDIHVVVGELERLRTLSDRLLLIAASQNPDFLTPEPADLGTLVAELVGRWQPTAVRRWQFGALEPAVALVDAERLGLALDALVENAVRHTREDDVIRVSVGLGDADWCASIVVEDSGDGIAESDLPHIFDRFRTITRPGSRGTGLGLALVQAIAQGHGGEVSVQSRLGIGSRFELRVPAVRRQADASVGLADEVTARHGRVAHNQAGSGQPGGMVEREAW
ncbi:MAG TPA: HAMP domain-containing sensor histidine kinase [Streptosporangiaceae bacterium]|nr:HAMP domain-containing sensor histidine kinase [Streptosporangiaceae bacterium]